MKIDKKSIFGQVGSSLPGIWNIDGSIELMDKLLALAASAGPKSGLDAGSDVLASSHNKLPNVVKTGGAIDDIDAALLRTSMPTRSLESLAPWVDPIKSCCIKYHIDEIREIAAFITTLAHEGGFIVGKRENMNYSAKRMAVIWPSRYAIKGNKKLPNKLAVSLHRKPELIANNVYANRMGNGPPESGDGWRYRGNGPTQLTGKDNHAAFAKAMNMTVEEAAEWIGTIEGGIMSAGWFWDENNINRLAMTPGISDETRRINGGTIGMADRKKKFDDLVAALVERENL